MGDSGKAGTRPNEGLIAGIPQNDDGMRTEPAPSVPIATGPIPDATAAAARKTKGQRLPRAPPARYSDDLSPAAVFPGDQEVFRRREAGRTREDHDGLGSIAIGTWFDLVCGCLDKIH